MALQLSHDPGWGTVYSEAYHRITSVIVEADGMAVIRVSSYKDAASRQDGVPSYTLRVYSMPFDPDSANNLLTDCYTHLKANEADFEGSVDV